MSGSSNVAVGHQQESNDCDIHVVVEPGEVVFKAPFTEPKQVTMFLRANQMATPTRHTYKTKSTHAGQFKTKPSYGFIEAGGTPAEVRLVCTAITEYPLRKDDHLTFVVGTVPSHTPELTSAHDLWKDEKNVPVFTKRLVVPIKYDPPDWTPPKAAAPPPPPPLQVPIEAPPPQQVPPPPPPQPREEPKSDRSASLKKKSQKSKKPMVQKQKDGENIRWLIKWKVE